MTEAPNSSIGDNANRPPPDPALPAKPRTNRKVEYAAPSEKGERLEEWMLTYMDTVTLLVTLFVLILSFASISEEKYAALLQGLRLDKYGTGIITGSSGIMDLPAVKPTPDKPVITDQQQDKVPPEEVSEQLNALIDSKGLSDLVSIKIGDGLLDIQLQDSVLFPSGSAKLLDNGRNVLSRLHTILDAGEFEISVHGHTDSVPISTVDFPSNWELSGGRAAAVVRALVIMGIDENRMNIAGFAHTRPVGDNETADGREMNRRVNIQLHASADEIEAILGK